MIDAGDFAITRWWWLRHAPVINPRDIIYGQTDIDIDLSDRAALTALAGRLPRGAHWIVTPLRRTRDTAQAIRAKATKLPDPATRLPEATPSVEVELIEQHFGDCQGRPAAEVYAERAAPEHPFRLDPARYRPEGGESFLDLMLRVQPAIERLSNRYLGRDIVAVAHGGTIRAAIALALDLAPEIALRCEIDPLSLTRLDRLSDKAAPPVWRVGGVNLPPR